jgi:hypothetical protein
MKINAEEEKGHWDKTRALNQNNKEWYLFEKKTKVAIQNYG